MIHGIKLVHIQSFLGETVIPISQLRTIIQGDNDQGKSVTRKAFETFAKPYDNDDYSALLSFDSDISAIYIYLDDYYVMRCILRKIPNKVTIQVTFLLTKGQDIIKSWDGWQPEVAQTLNWLSLVDNNNKYYPVNIKLATKHLLLSEDKKENGLVVDSLQRDLELETGIENLKQDLKQIKTVRKTRMNSLTQLRKLLSEIEYKDISKAEEILATGRYYDRQFRNKDSLNRYILNFIEVKKLTKNLELITKYNKLLSLYEAIQVVTKINNLKENIQTINKVLQSRLLISYIQSINVKQKLQAKNQIITDYINKQNLYNYLINQYNLSQLKRQEALLVNYKHHLMCLEFINYIEKSKLVQRGQKQISRYLTLLSLTNYCKQKEQTNAMQELIGLANTYYNYRLLISYIQLHMSKYIALQRRFLEYYKSYRKKQYLLEYIEEKSKADYFKQGICPTCRRPIGREHIC